MADLITMLSAAAGGKVRDPDFNSTVLLLHGDGTNGAQNNTFLDSSTNNFTITRNGNTTQGTFSPFSRSSGNLVNAPYDPAVHGGSGYFDGTGDYLSIADAAGLRFGTGNFTIQCWIYRNAAGAVHSIAAKGGASTGWVFQVHSDNKLRFTHTTTNIDSTGTIPASAWTHVAVVREGTGTNQVKLYINGVNDGQGTVSTDFTQTEQLNIGADRGNSNVMNGYIAGWKYVVGTAETITVPTAPPTGGTALLNFTNAGIIDNTGKNNLETVGNAQIDTAVKKYGTGSLEFDGDDFLKIPSSPLVEINGSDFTMEFWVRFNSVGGDAALISKYGNSAETLGGQGYVLQWVQSTAVLRLVLGNNPGGADQLYTWSWSPSINVWYHVAVTRSGTSGRAFVDGTQIGSTLTLITNDVVSPNALQIGKTHTVSQYLNGYIDDLRITKGVARYTANFTAPTKAFPDQ